MAVQLTGGVGEAMTAAGNKVKKRWTAAQRAAARDQKEQAVREHLTTLQRATAVVLAIREGKFSWEDGIQADELQSLLASLKPAEVRQIGTAAGVKVSGTVGGIKIDPVAAVVDWFKAGGLTPRQRCDKAFRERDAATWGRLAPAVYTAAQVKELVKDDINGDPKVGVCLKFGGSKTVVIGVVVRFLSGTLNDTDHKRAVAKSGTKANTWMTPEVETQLAAAAAAKGISVEQALEMLQELTAIKRRLAAEKKAADQKIAAAKIGNIF